MADELKRELTPREAAQRLGIRLDALYALLWASRLVARKQDGRWLISRESVEARAAKRAALRLAA